VRNVIVRRRWEISPNYLIALSMGEFRLIKIVKETPLDREITVSVYPYPIGSSQDCMMDAIETVAKKYRTMLEKYEEFECECKQTILVRTMSPLFYNLLLSLIVDEAAIRVRSDRSLEE